jgi:hypothetical protein
MAIDNPLDQAELILSNEKRQSNPMNERFGKIASFCKAVGSAAAAFARGDTVDALGTAVEGLKGISDAMADDNSEYMLAIVISELRFLTGKYDSLEAQHRRFLDTDWLTLLVDADRKARQIRAKERVGRLARVLINAAEAQASPAAEHVEEMLRIAMSLDVIDVMVLGEAVRVQGNLVTNAERPSLMHATDTWKLAKWPEMNLSREAVVFATEKLQSLGLLQALEQPNNLNATAKLVRAYLLTRRGLDFIRSLQQTVAP